MNARMLFSFVILAAAGPIVAVAAQAQDQGLVGQDLGAFHADCRFSHRAPDDAIVFPGQPGASHSHDFIGNRSTDAFSTPQGLRERLSNCQRDDEVKGFYIPSDRSAYWVPTLYVGDTPVAPASATAYYTTGRRELNIEPFPDNLEVLAGTSTGGPQEIGGQRVYWVECGGETVSQGSATVAPTCATRDLRLEIRFPDCWDGEHVDSPNHKSHMAYSSQVGDRWACPRSHPVQVPKLKLGLRYPTTGGPTVRLASGGINTAHADFMNGWARGKLEQLVRDCLNADRYCGGQSAPVEGH